MHYKKTSTIKVKRGGPKQRRKTTEKFCHKCNKMTEFYIYQRTKGRRGSGPDSRCRICALNYERNKISKNKSNWVKWKGGKCLFCGLVDDISVYDLHHIDPEIKKFSMYTKVTRCHSADIENELRKCVLLCCLCHRKIENGLISLSQEQIEQGLKLDIDSQADVPITMENV